MPHGSSTRGWRRSPSWPPIARKCGRRSCAHAAPRLESETWSQLCFYEFDGAEHPTGAESLGFEHLDDGILLARLPATPSSSAHADALLPSRAFEHELQALRDLASDCAHSPRGLGPEVRSRAGDLDADALATCIGDGIVLVARQDDQPVGCIALEVSGKTTHLRLLAVRRESRRQGVGSALVLGTIDWARTNGMTVIVAATDAANAGALALYDQAGFSVVGRLRFLRWRSPRRPSSAVTG